MQAKYYTNATFLEAHLGMRPSYARRSILHARAVLEEGLIWRVANGERISVWRDKWLPIPSTFKVQSPVNLLSDDAQVFELIDQASWCRNISLIHSVFSLVKPLLYAVCALVLLINRTNGVEGSKEWDILGQDCISHGSGT
jgi:hypothetical protein